MHNLGLLVLIRVIRRLLHNLNEFVSFVGSRKIGVNDFVAANPPAGEC